MEKGYGQQIGAAETPRDSNSVKTVKWRDSKLNSFNRTSQGYLRAAPNRFFCWYKIRELENQL